MPSTPPNSRMARQIASMSLYTIVSCRAAATSTRWTLCTRHSSQQTRALPYEKQLPRRYGVNKRARIPLHGTVAFSLVLTPPSSKEVEHPSVRTPRLLHKRRLGMAALDINAKLKMPSGYDMPRLGFGVCTHGHLTPPPSSVLAAPGPDH